MREHNEDDYKTVAILGSFGKHYDIIVETANIFKAHGIQPLVPKLDGIQDDNESFILLVGDDNADPKRK